MSVAAATKEDTDFAIASAETAFHAWKCTTARERSRVLYRWCWRLVCPHCMCTDVQSNEDAYGAAVECHRRWDEPILAASPHRRTTPTQSGNTSSRPPQVRTRDRAQRRPCDNPHDGAGEAFRRGDKGDRLLRNLLPVVRRHKPRQLVSRHLQPRHSACGGPSQCDWNRISRAFERRHSDADSGRRAENKVMYSFPFCRFSEEAVRAYGMTYPGPATDRRGMTIKQPIGVCAACAPRIDSPWSFQSCNEQTCCPPVDAAAWVQHAGSRPGIFPPPCWRERSPPASLRAARWCVHPAFACDTSDVKPCHHASTAFKA